ncbi:hypothetical protein CERSUDRAFT_150904 [Gelatoporia subvermispora B]|uniref:Uncharacterized protein n=1 Tax=Ceriporiopsis subvermispora (strain B) TaxID=914234 RepID=M2RMF0_CERS8|nr:hypothetical protein CERSUDRAFT_150904 [Gelatoporia subvermispora B]
MGFFASRKTEQSETIIQDDTAVVRVIRSRFYGKAKGKERDTGSASPAPSSLSPSQFSLSEGSRSFASNRAAGSSTSLRHTFYAANSPPSPLNPRTENARTQAGCRSSADPVTMTLAQRLNELATANEEGLLSDEEYRLLRQNLFERFANGSALPSETPLVRMSGSHAGMNGQSSPGPHQRRPSSNFHLQAPSVRSNSKKSLTSSVTGLLRRVTSKRVASASLDVGGSDAMSVFSSTSTSPPMSTERHTLPRSLSKQLSDSSLKTDDSFGQLFRRPSMAGRPSDVSGPSSLRSRRRGASNPPSSFQASSVALDTSDTLSYTTDAIPNDDTVDTAKDLRKQIELVEAEGRRLLDAFNGLELSTLTRHHRRPPMIPPLPSHGSLTDLSRQIGSSSSVRSLRTGKDIDAMSLKSGGSIRTTISSKRAPSTNGRRRAPTASSSLAPHQGSLTRKSSLASMSSRQRITIMASTNMPTHLGSSSSVNLMRSTGHLPLATVAEAESKRQSQDMDTSPNSHGHTAVGATSPDTVRPSRAVNGTRRVIDVEEEEIRAMETELADIRRRRTEVTARYEARLEYLRARLKGAELREKLLRK